ncbi:MAG: MFS transporter [Paracoccaceae bacterium]|nr:MFS transporter [Paracoccaceae bacterium]
MNLSALNFRDFRIYLGGNLFAVNALWMQRVTIGWIAWDLTSSATFVGFIAFLSFAPSMVTGPLFGVLIDRVRLKQAAKLTQLLLFTIALGFYLFFTFGILDEIVLSLLSGLSGLVVSAHNPVRMSLAPRLVDRISVASVVTIVAINFNLARLIGPAIGGWMIAVWGISAALLVQTMCYLPFIFAISLLRPRERLSSKTEHEPFLSALNSGIRHTLENSLIRQALLITALYAFLIRGTLEILPVIADGVFSRGATGLGLLTSSAGFGAVVAGVTKVFIPSQITGKLPKFALASALLGIGIVPLVGFSSSWELTLGCISYLGFSGTLSGISVQTALQIDLDDDLRGRVMSLWTMVNTGATATGAIVLGGLADYIGFSLALSLAGGLGTVFLATIVLRVK